jgi:hypothetical protein
LPEKGRWVACQLPKRPTTVTCRHTAMCKTRSLQRAVCLNTCKTYVHACRHVSAAANASGASHASVYQLLDLALGSTPPGHSPYVSAV